MNVKLGYHGLQGDIFLRQRINFEIIWWNISKENRKGVDGVVDKQDKFEELLLRFQHLLTVEQLIQARDIYRLAHEKNVEAMIELAYLYKIMEEYSLVVFWLQKAGKAGNSEALYQLANCYYEGLGVEEDVKMAFQLYKKAAKRDIRMPKITWPICI